MGQIDEMEAKIDWLVEAVKHLLSEELDTPVIADPHQGQHVAALDEVEDWIAPVHAPKPPKAKPCPHNQQVLVDGALTCARCGYLLTTSGVQQNRLANDGRVIQDPNPPQWATEHSPGASSKNPGTPLVPFSS